MKLPSYPSNPAAPSPATLRAQFRHQALSQVAGEGKGLDDMETKGVNWMIDT